MDYHPRTPRRVNLGCEPNTTTPDYVSRLYNDPLTLYYDPPLGSYYVVLASER